jgi:hypothetical protein
MAQGGSDKELESIRHWQQDQSAIDFGGGIKAKRRRSYSCGAKLATVGVWPSKMNSSFSPGFEIWG